MDRLLEGQNGETKAVTPPDITVKVPAQGPKFGWITGVLVRIVFTYLEGHYCHEPLTNQWGINEEVL